MTVAEARCLFDSVISHLPITKSRLCVGARIVQCPDFEAGVVKIQEGRPFELTESERELTDVLKMSAHQSVNWKEQD